MTDTEVLTLRAMRDASMLQVGLGLTTVWSWASAWIAPLAGLRATVGWTLLAAVVALAVNAIVSGGRPIQARTGFDLDFMVSAVWLIGFFALVVPGAQLVALGVGIWRLRARSVGGYNTVKEGSTKYYPKISLDQGEGRPLGVTFVTLGTLWPVAVASFFLAPRFIR